MKILVTGGAGYIGSVLVPMLLANGHKVRVLDNLMYGGASMLSLFQNSEFSFIKGDIRDPDTVSKAVSDCDVVIHLAAIVGFPACRKNPDLAQSVNFGGTKVIADTVGKNRLVLYGSTGSNYGALVDEVCTEETALNPLSLYGKTKTAAELYLREHCQTVAFRFATAFGVSPRLRLDLLVNEFVHLALKMRYLVVYESSFMRTFIHVRDMARAFLFALENQNKMVGQVYNVGSEDMNYSKAQVAEMIRKRVEFYLHYAEVGEDADKRNYVVSYKKLNSLGYKTTVSLPEGIDELVRTLEVLDISNPFTNI